MTRKLLHEYMDEAMAEAAAEERIDRYYAKLLFYNTVRACETSYSVMTHPVSPSTANARHRMTKEIAQELIEQHGPLAAVHCLEKLANDTPQPRMWHDVMEWINELQGEKNVNDEL